MLRCGLFRTNGVFAMADTVLRNRSRRRAASPGLRRGVAVPGPATLLRRLCLADAWREEGQPRAPASHAAAVAPCGGRPAGFMTAAKNMPSRVRGQPWGATDFRGRARRTPRHAR